MLSAFIVSVIITIVTISSIYMGYRLKNIHDIVNDMGSKDNEYASRIKAMNEVMTRFDTRENASMGEAQIYGTLQQVKRIMEEGVEQNQNALLSEALAREELEQRSNREINALESRLTLEEINRKNEDRALLSRIIREETDRHNIINELTTDLDTLASASEEAISTLRRETLSNYYSLSNNSDRKLQPIIKDTDAKLAYTRDEYSKQFKLLSDDINSKIQYANNNLNTAVTRINQDYTIFNNRLDAMAKNLDGKFATWTVYAASNDKYKAGFDIWRGDATTSQSNLTKSAATHSNDINTMMTNSTDQFRRLFENDISFSNQLRGLKTTFDQQVNMMQTAMTTNDATINNRLRMLSDAFTDKTIQSSKLFSAQSLSVGPSPYSVTAEVVNNNTLQIKLPNVPNARMEVRNASGDPLQTINANGVVSSMTSVAGNTITDVLTAKNVTLCNETLGESACIRGPTAAMGSLCFDNRGFTIEGRVVGGKKQVQFDGNLVLGAHGLESANDGLKIVKAAKPTELSSITACNIIAKSISGNPVNITGTLRATNIVANNATVGGGINATSNLMVPSIHTSKVTLNNTSVIERNEDQLRVNLNPRGESCAKESLSIACGGRDRIKLKGNGNIEAVSVTAQNTKVNGRTTTNDMHINNRLGLGINPDNMGNTKLFVQTPTSDWQVHYANGNRKVSMNHGGGYGMQINTADTSYDKYGIEVFSGKGALFRVRNDGTSEVHGRLFVGGQEVTPAMVQTLQRL